MFSPTPTSELIILGLAIVLGSIASYYGILAKKYAIEENRGFLKFRAMGLCLLAIGFLIHAIGDYFGVSYEGGMGMLIQSGAHVVIFISFVYFILASKKILNSARRYWLE